MMTIDEFARETAREDTQFASKSPTAVPPPIRDENGRLNAFILVMADEARRAGGRRPIANSRPGRIADRCMVCRSRSRICSTSPARRPRPPRAFARDTSPTSDAPLITRLRQAGAVIVGKTEPARVRVRNDERGLGIRSGAPPSRSDPVAGRFERRIGREPGCGNGARDARHRYRRFDPDSRGHLRHRRPQTDVGRAADRRRRSRCREHSITRAR